MKASPHISSQSSSIATSSNHEKSPAQKLRFLHWVKMGLTFQAWAGLFYLSWWCAVTVQCTVVVYRCKVCCTGWQLQVCLADCQLSWDRSPCQTCRHPPPLSVLTPVLPRATRENVRQDSIVLLRHSENTTLCHLHDCSAPHQDDQLTVRKIARFLPSKRGPLPRSGFSGQSSFSVLPPETSF